MILENFILFIGLLHFSYINRNICKQPLENKKLLADFLWCHSTHLVIAHVYFLEVQKWYIFWWKSLFYANLIFSKICLYFILVSKFAALIVLHFFLIQQISTTLAPPDPPSRFKNFSTNIHNFKQVTSETNRK